MRPTKVEAVALLKEKIEEVEGMIVSVWEQVAKMLMDRDAWREDIEQIPDLAILLQIGDNFQIWDKLLEYMNEETAESPEGEEPRAEEDFLAILTTLFPAVTMLGDIAIKRALVIVLGNIAIKRAEEAAEALQNKTIVEDETIAEYIILETKEVRAIAETVEARQTTEITIFEMTDIAIVKYLLRTAEKAKWTQFSVADMEKWVEEDNINKIIFKELKPIRKRVIKLIKAIESIILKPRLKQIIALNEQMYKQYLLLLKETEILVEDLFTKEDAKEFKKRHSTRSLYKTLVSAFSINMGDSSYERTFARALIAHPLALFFVTVLHIPGMLYARKFTYIYTKLLLCILELEVYENRLAYRSSTVRRHGEKPFYIIIAETIERIIMDINSIGDITKSNVGAIAQGGSTVQGGGIISQIADSGQSELAQALQDLISAVTTSKDLTEEQKRDHVEIITTIAEETTKDKPNKSLLKGLLATLKAIPDVANAVNAIEPILHHLHL